jgi:hypothetical protein
MNDGLTHLTLLLDELEIMFLKVGEFVNPLDNPRRLEYKVIYRSPGSKYHILILFSPLFAITSFKALNKVS